MGRHNKSQGRAASRAFMANHTTMALSSQYRGSFLEKAAVVKPANRGVEFEGDVGWGVGNGNAKFALLQTGGMKWTRVLKARPTVMLDKNGQLVRRHETSEGYAQRQLTAKEDAPNP